MFVKNTCIICGNDDADLFEEGVASEICSICGSSFVANEIVDGESYDYDTSYEKLF